MSTNSTTPVVKDTNNIIASYQFSLGQKVSKSFTAIATETRILNSAIKVVASGALLGLAVLRCLPGIAGCGTGLTELAKRMSGARDFINATGLMSGIPDLMDALKEPWVELAKLATLVAAMTLGSIAYVDSCSGNFFSQAALCIGSIPVISLAKVSFITISAGFCIYLAFKKIAASRARKEKATEKQEKWENRAWMINDKVTKEDVIKGCNFELVLERNKLFLLKATELSSEKGRAMIEKISSLQNNLLDLKKNGLQKEKVKELQSSQLKQLKAKYEAKLKSKKDEINKMEGGEAKTKAEEGAKKRIELLKAYVKSFSDPSKAKSLFEHKAGAAFINSVLRPDGSASESEASTEVENNLMGGKYKLRQHDEKIDGKSACWSLASNVAKIGGIVLAISVILMTPTFPILAGATAGVIVSALSFLSYNVGLAKNLYKVAGEQKVKEEAYDFKPVSAATA